MHSSGMCTVRSSGRLLYLGGGVKKCRKKIWGRCLLLGGCLTWGVSAPGGSALGGGCLLWGVGVCSGGCLLPGGGVSQHALRQTPPSHCSQHVFFNHAATPSYPTVPTICCIICLANSPIHKAAGQPAAIQNGVWRLFCMAVPH